MSSDTAYRGRDGGRGDLAGDSTHFRPREILEPEDGKKERTRQSDAFSPSTKSMRLSPRPTRGALAARIGLPILIALVASLIVAAFVIRQRVYRLQLENLEGAAADTAYAAAVLGRTFLTLRAEFLAHNPAYLERSEWLAGGHWLVAQGLVGADEWREATGFEANEYAPIEVLESASERMLLGELAGWVTSPQFDSNLVSLYLLDQDTNLVASTRSLNFSFDPIALKSVPLPNEYVEVAGNRVYVDFVDSLDSEPVVRAVARIFSRRNPDQRLGSAVVVMHTLSLERGQRAFFITLLIVLAGMTVVLALAAWLSTRRVTAPLRQLAADMQAMAEGDYSRRFDLNAAGEIGLLAQAFNSMAERMRVAWANEKENSRLESDLAIARGIQNNLLPLQTPRVRGLDIHTSYRPAREIGGDYFDFLPVDSQHMGLVVADASGKSIPAALVMSTTRAILRFVAPGNNSAAETLTKVNAILSVDIPKGMFVTAYYVVLDPLNSSMICASAGHTPLLIARNDGSVELLNPGGIALGFDSGPIFQRSIREQRVKLEEGDRVLLYTDGVVECVNPANEEYSDRRLREFLRRNRDMTSHDFVGALLADLDRHRGTAEMRDDTTIVTFKVL